MAEYYKIAAAAEAEAFDGTQAVAEALVAAYPDIISIASPSETYPELEGDVTLDAASTGTNVNITLVKEDVYTPYEIEFDVVGAPTASGNLTITFFEEDPIVVAVTDVDDALTVAAAIAGETFPGFTAVDNLDGTVTVTQDLDDQGTAILNVLTQENTYLNAYKDTYIVWMDEMAEAPFETSKTQIWPATWFGKYFIPTGS